MKNLLMLGLALMATSAFTQSITGSGLCEGRSQQEIEQHVRIIEEGLSNGEMDVDLANFSWTV